MTSRDAAMGPQQAPHPEGFSNKSSVTPLGWGQEVPSSERSLEGAGEVVTGDSILKNEVGGAGAARCGMQSLGGLSLCPRFPWACPCLRGAAGQGPESHAPPEDAAPLAGRLRGRERLSLPPEAQKGRGVLPAPLSGPPATSVRQRPPPAPPHPPMRTGLCPAGPRRN